MFWHHVGIVGLLSGIITLVLVVGDYFHLIPCIIAAISGDRTRLKSMLGFGKFIVSIMMILHNELIEATINNVVK